MAAQNLERAGAKEAAAELVRRADFARDVAADAVDQLKKVIG
jgi:hypothetical protein